MIYTNLLDSVVFASFKGSPYKVKGIKEEYESEIELLLKKFNKEEKEYMEGLAVRPQEKTKEDEQLVITLNQICDNSFLMMKNQDEHFKLLEDLINNHKIKISTYDEMDLIKYTKKNLEESLIRLAAGEKYDDSVFVSSLFSFLGNKNTDKLTRRGIEFLLGEYKNLKYDKNSNTFLVGDNRYSLEDIENENMSVYKAFCENEDIVDVKGELNKKIEINDINKWIHNIHELNKLAIEKNVFVSQDGCGNNLSQFMGKLLENGILKGKINNWIRTLNYADNEKEIKDGIVAVLNNLCNSDSGITKRTSMYLNVRDKMQEYAEDKKDKKISRFFEVYPEQEKDSRSHHKPYLGVLYTCIMAIDFSYNLLYAYNTTGEGNILECQFRFEYVNDTYEVVDFEINNNNYNL